MRPSVRAPVRASFCPSIRACVRACARARLRALLLHVCARELRRSRTGAALTWARGGCSYKEPGELKISMLEGKADKNKEEPDNDSSDEEEDFSRGAKPKARKQRRVSGAAVERSGMAQARDKTSRRDDASRVIEITDSDGEPGSLKRTRSDGLDKGVASDAGGKSRALALHKVLKPASMQNACSKFVGSAWGDKLLN